MSNSLSPKLMSFEFLLPSILTSVFFLLIPQPFTLNFFYSLPPTKSLLLFFYTEKIYSPLGLFLSHLIFFSISHSSPLSCRLFKCFPPHRQRSIWFQVWFILPSLKKPKLDQWFCQLLTNLTPFLLINNGTPT